MMCRCMTHTAVWYVFFYQNVLRLFYWSSQNVFYITAEKLVMVASMAYMNHNTHTLSHKLKLLSFSKYTSSTPESTYCQAVNNL